MPENSTINYIELGASDLEAIKKFYSSVFGWTFKDFGPSYTAFKDGFIDGGFTTDAPVGKGPLVVLYHDHLEKIQETVKEHGGKIVKEIFSFPGGRRFHFEDPSGNELAVWSDK